MPEPILTLEELKRRAIVDALERCNGNVAEAAKLLGISRSGLYQYLADIKYDRPMEQSAALKKGKP